MYKYVISAFDENGNNDNPFITIYEQAVNEIAPCYGTKDEAKRSLEYEDYCHKHIPGIDRVVTEFELGVFIRAILYFKDEASLAWFKLKYC